MFPPLAVASHISSITSLTLHTRGMHGLWLFRNMAFIYYKKKHHQPLGEGVKNCTDNQGGIEGHFRSHPSKAGLGLISVAVLGVADNMVDIET